MSILQNQNAFKIEAYRSELARKNNIEELRKTYKSALPEIKNLNLPTLWDKLNKREELKSERNYMEEDKLHWVAKLIPQKKLNILNIGFGSANLEQIILLKYKNIYGWYGIDISKSSVKDANLRFNSINFSVGDIRNLIYKNNFFEYVIALEVLEHISPRNIIGAIEEVHRVLKKGGRFIISVPLNEDLEKMIKDNNNFNAHVRIYTPELIRAELEIGGFKVEKFKIIYAFRNLYSFKSFIVKNIFKQFRQPNGIIIVAQKK
jgi:SAM-dependent methyltransferase